MCLCKQCRVRQDTADLSKLFRHEQRCLLETCIPHKDFQGAGHKVKENLFIFVTAGVRALRRSLNLTPYITKV